MNDERLIGQLLQLQTQRLTKIQQALDRLTAQLDAATDTLDRMRRDHNSKEDTP